MPTGLVVLDVVGVTGMQALQDLVSSYAPFDAWRAHSGSGTPTSRIPASPFPTRPAG